MPGCGFGAESGLPPVCNAVTSGALATEQVVGAKISMTHMMVGPSCLRDERGGLSMGKIPSHILKAARNRNLAVTVRVGKSGLTESIMNEISEQLSARGLIKIKFNRGIFEADDKKVAIQMICTNCNATLAEAKGNVAIVYRP